MTNPSAARLEHRFQELLATHGAGLKRLARAYFSDNALQQDLFQEIALAVWSALPRYRAASSERTWLYRIAHNVALTAKAKYRKREKCEEPLGDHEAAAPGDSDDRTAMFDLIRRLGEVDRQLLLLHLEGLTGPEISAVTGLTVTNVGVRLMRAREKLIQTVRSEVKL